MQRKGRESHQGLVVIATKILKRIREITRTNKQKKIYRDSTNISTSPEVK